MSRPQLGEVWVVTFDDGETFQIAEVTGAFGTPRWSPVGNDMDSLLSEATPVRRLAERGEWCP